MRNVYAITKRGFVFCAAECVAPIVDTTRTTKVTVISNFSVIPVVLVV